MMEIVIILALLVVLHVMNNHATWHWHKWSKWEDSQAAYYYPKQSRKCDKCGLKQHRQI